MLHLSGECQALIAMARGVFPVSQCVWVPRSVMGMPKAAFGQQATAKVFASGIGQLPSPGQVAFLAYRQAQICALHAKKPLHSSQGQRGENILSHTRG